jgi:hypothetical protein
VRHTLILTVKAVPGGYTYTVDGQTSGQIWAFNDLVEHLTARYPDLKAFTVSL